MYYNITETTGMSQFDLYKINIESLNCIYIVILCSLHIKEGRNAEIASLSIRNTNISIEHALNGKSHTGYGIKQLIDFICTIYVHLCVHSCVCAYLCVSSLSTDS
jgi:hypothetical protein